MTDLETVQHAACNYSAAADTTVRSPLLDLQGLGKFFHRSAGVFSDPQKMWAVRDVDLSLYTGETLGLVGESGCGKSTLARMAAGLLKPDAGRVLFSDEPVFCAHKSNGRDSDKISKELLNAMPGHLQMVFQDPYSSLNPRIKIGASIAEPLVCAKVPSRECAARVDELLAEVGLPGEAKNRYPHEFSGGQRQRVALARALSLKPEIVLCDEPVSALDASVQAQVLNLLKEMQEKFFLSYLFISHDLAVISHMSDRVGVMYLGRVVELASSEDFFRGPLHPYSRLLLESMPRKGRRAQIDGGAGQRSQAKMMQCIHAQAGSSNPGKESDGCPFYALCPENMGEVCRDIAPGLFKKGRTEVRCHMYG